MLPRTSSPFLESQHNTGWIMRQVVLAAIPGTAMTIYWAGWGVFANIIIASLTALTLEAIVFLLRRRSVLFYLSDYSALVTALLLGVALPGSAPWWIAVSGSAFAIIIAKHLYGGLGYNPFNPAMAGYVFLLISFPLPMTQWPELGNVDGVTAATPLEFLQQNTTLSMAELWNGEILPFGPHDGFAWINIAFLLGGIYMLARKIFTWHAPVSMLVTLGLASAFFYDNGSATSQGSPLFHWFNGATMLGAFFIITEPVTSATHPLGRLIYGTAIGLAVFIIRAWGTYPEAIAFAVLLMNFAAPLIDRYTQSRVYGH